MNKINALTLIAIIALTSCTTEDNSNQNAIVSDNLTGTWVSTTIEKKYDNANLLLYTNTVYSTFYITESDSEIQISDCEKYNNPLFTPSSLIKNSDTLDFASILETSFSIVSQNELFRTYDVATGIDTTNYNQTLIKTSSTIDLSRGELQLNGPISANNQSHVCLYQRFGEDLNQGSKQKILIPFDNDILEWNIGVSQPLVVGDYQYDIAEASNSPVLFTFDVISNSDTFWNSIGSNGLTPDLASLIITTSQEDLIKGNFSFIGQDAGNYTGDFNVIPY